MNIAILTNLDLRDTPCQWTGSERHRLFVFADADSACGGQFTDFQAVSKEGTEFVKLYSNYMNNGNVEDDILALHRRQGIDALVALGEDDIIRAARLRGHLGIDGQTLESAIAFRNKGVMKDHLSRAGIPVTPYRVLDSALDLILFKKRHGLPLIIKPTSASGSSGLQTLRTQEQYRDFLADGLRSRIPCAEYGGDLVAEALVEGSQYHVDGFVLEGKTELIVPSEYLTPILPKCSATVAPEDPIYARLVSFARSALEALPRPPTFSFHAEIFRTSSDRLLLNEIASRTGGGKIGSVVASVCGVELNRISVMGQVDAESARKVLKDARPMSRCAGVSLLSPTDVELYEAPDGCPLPFVSDFLVYQSIGYRWKEPSTTAPMLAAAVIRGNTCVDVRAGLKQFNEWFLSSFTKPLPAATVESVEGGSCYKGELK